MSHNQVLIDIAENLFTHMRMIRRKTIVEKDRAAVDPRPYADHRSAGARTPRMCRTVVRDHALGLAEQCREYADYLD